MRDHRRPLTAQAVVDGFFFLPPPFFVAASGGGGGGLADGGFVEATLISLTVEWTARYRLYSGPSSLWMSASRPVVTFFLSSLVPLACLALRSFFMSCGRWGTQDGGRVPVASRAHAIGMLRDRAMAFASAVGEASERERGGERGRAWHKSERSGDALQDGAPRRGRGLTSMKGRFFSCGSDLVKVLKGLLYRHAHSLACKH